jgi:hypothetical protein
MQYREVVDDATDPKSNNSSSTSAPATTATSRSEQVWGGKPWKTNVVDLEGEVLCSMYAKASLASGKLITRNAC